MTEDHKTLVGLVGWHETGNDVTECERGEKGCYVRNLGTAALKRDIWAETWMRHSQTTWDWRKKNAENGESEEQKAMRLHKGWLAWEVSWMSRA